MGMGMSRGNEAFEEGMRLMRFAVEFGMELAGDKERVLGQFDNLDQLAVRGEAAENIIGFLEAFTVGVVEFVAVPVAFVHHESSVEAGRLGPHDELARL